MSTGPEASPSVPIPPWRFAARLAWIALRIVLVIFLGQGGSPFFYQGF